MIAEKWELFLDESGEFKDDTLRRDFNPSLVGGVLCRAGTVTEAQANEWFGGQRAHATEEKSAEAQARNFNILRKLKQLGCRFVVFENTEHLMIVNGDITYLNILAEGIVKLLVDLSAASASQVHLAIKIATRNNVAQKDARGVIVDLEPEEYVSRLNERIILAIGDKAVPGAAWEVSFARATKDGHLKLADVVCNYYLTRNAPLRFSVEERAELANSLFKDVTLYSVFEDSTVRMARRLMAEGQFGEVMGLIASARRETKKLENVRTDLFVRLKRMSAKERDFYFRYVSLKLGIYVDRRNFSEGRPFAENYRNRILCPLLDDESMGDIVHRWMFDTDFYLMTMADHMGDARGCEYYRESTQDNLSIVLQGWEQLDYYYTYRIREINVMMGRFDFDGVLETAKSLEAFIREAQALGDLVRDEAHLPDPQSSVSYGKVRGQSVEAYVNLLGKRPELLEKALVASDEALDEFRTEEDRVRQYQYRAEIYVRVKQPEKALAALTREEVGEGNFSEVCKTYLNKAFESVMTAREFALMHYSNVMRAFVEAKDPRGPQMAELLVNDSRFREELMSEKPGTGSGHPWQITLWNIGAWYRENGNINKWNEYSKRALDIARSNRDYISMLTFAVSISADRLLTARQRQDKRLNEAEKEFAGIISELKAKKIPETISAWYGIGDEAAAFDDDRLKRIADAWLR